MYVHNYQTNIVYTVSKTGSLEPVYADKNLKENGFANQGNRLLILKPHYCYDDDTKAWLCGADTIKI